MSRANSNLPSFCLPVDMDAATTSNVLPTQYVTIEEECKRNPKLKISELQILKDWMDEQRHLPQIEMSYLILFLHQNDYLLQPTKKMIDEFFTIRTQIPEVFFNRDPIGHARLRDAFTALAIVPLEEKTKDGVLMVFLKILDANPRLCDMHESLKYLFMICDLLHIRNGTSKGQIIIVDVSGLSFGHLSRVNLTHIKKIIYYIQEVIPVELHAIHILNTMYLVKIALNILKPFLNAKLLNILHFHRTLETLKEFLPIEALPNEYGGKGESIIKLHAKNIKLLEENREWFLHENGHLKVNESLRINESSEKNLSDGLRKVEID